jgi:hypothetical protein
MKKPPQWVVSGDHGLMLAYAVWLPPLGKFKPKKSRLEGLLDLVELRMQKAPKRVLWGFIWACGSINGARLL